MMKGSMSTDLGIITINPEVIAKYAGSMAIECFGIVGMAAVNMKDGLVKLLKRDYLTHGINVDVDENNKITIRKRKKKECLVQQFFLDKIWDDIC